MNITLEQARTFESIARLGTIQLAADELGKGHSGILYQVRSLEDQTGLKLFDRTGYRNKLTDEGELVLKYCQRLIQTESELAKLCVKLHGGWEPSLKLVYDGVIDFNLIGSALSKLNNFQSPTDIQVYSAHLDEVAERFEKEQADFMVTIIPFENAKMATVELAPIRMLLVADKKHALNINRRKKQSIDELKAQTYIKVKTDHIGLGLSTEQVAINSSFLVNDFATKKQAIIKGLGYGWLPSYQIEKELKSGKLKIINSELKCEHFLYPKIYHTSKKLLGKTALALLNLLEQ